MTKFHNPYHFVPIAKTTGDGPTIAGFRDRTPDAVSHACYSPDNLSGRMICRAKAVTPIVIGGEQISGEGTRSPGVVHPFLLDGEPALPASSLRGLVSATAEAASNSTLRVLTADWDKWEDAFRKKGARSQSSAVAEFERIDPDLVPLGKSGKRRRLTAAELLFGFVEHRDKGKGRQTSALAYASRVRFSHAIAKAGVELENAVTLRELSSPKPPRASFYFQPSSRKKLPPSGSQPKGRKFYLPHPEQGAVGWGSTRDPRTPKEKKASERQLSVRPIPATTEFWFAIDFDNLSEGELDLLCYALVPIPSYLHRLGLGKPLGLGLVQIDVAGIFLVDRAARYGGNADCSWVEEPRYHSEWVAADQDLAIARWPERERFVVGRRAAAPRQTGDPSTRAARFRAAAIACGHGEIIESLEMMGNRTLVRHPVHYPAKAGAGLEDNLFQWFASGPNESLPVLPNGGVLPALNR